MTAPPVTDHELSAYIDGETPPARRRAIQSWLAASPEAAAKAASFRGQNEWLRAHFGAAGALAAPRPARGSVPQRSGAEPLREALLAGGPAAPWRARLAVVAIGSFLGGAAAALAGVFLLGLGPAFLAGAKFITARPVEALHIADPVQTLSAAAVAAHRAFAFDTARPVEFSGADMAAQVSRRAGFAIRPADLAASGYRLLGGRVVPTGFGVSGFLVYESKDGERLGLSISPANGLAVAEPVYSEAPVTAALWTQDGRAFALTGRGGRDVLAPYVERLRAVK